VIVNSLREPSFVFLDKQNTCPNPSNGLNKINPGKILIATQVNPRDVVLIFVKCVDKQSCDSKEHERDRNNQFGPKQSRPDYSPHSNVSDIKETVQASQNKEHTGNRT
jgi:hypothetical protein